MSEGNTELAREVFDAVTRQDVTRLIALTDAEVEWHSFFALGEADSVYRGHPGIERYVRDLHDAWEVVNPDIEDSLETGAVVVLVGRVRYRGRSSGVQTDSPAGWMLKFRAGKVLVFRAFGEPEQALEAAGLKK
jgi:ketosteroid isomerase-like protein